MNATWKMKLVNQEGQKKVIPVTFKEAGVPEIIWLMAQMYKDEAEGGWFPDGLEIELDVNERVENCLDEKPNFLPNERED